MAELTLKVGSSSSYEDGDILCAFNRRRIRCVHAEHICSAKLAGLTRDGLRPAGSLARQALEVTRQYRFDRLSRYVVRRTDLRTATVVEFSDQPDANGKYIDVPQFLSRRLKHPRHSIFGLVGREIWFGGKTFVAHADLDLVWQEIESRSSHRASDYTLWPAGQQELKSHLFITVDDFDDAETNKLVESEYDNKDPENPVLIRKRKQQVEWEQLEGVVADQVRDKTRVVDTRKDRSYNRLAVVETKVSP